MNGEEFKTLQDLMQQLDKNPEFRREYRRQAPFYDLILEIIHRRKELGLTQQELADKVGTYQSNISKIEAGEVNVRLSTLVDIAEALETRLQIWFVPFYDAENDDSYQKLFQISSKSSGAAEYYAPSEQSYEVTAKS